MARGGSKAVTAVISFLLGFLFAIIVEIGAVIGVYVFITTQDLDTVLSTFGINNTDENGNKIYINTDKNNGGVSNLGELLSALQNLLMEDGDIATALGRTLDDFENLIPATNILLGMVYDATEGILPLDKEEFESTPLNGLAQVLSSSIMNVRTATLLETLGMESITGDDANGLVKTLIIGAESEYATVYYSSRGDDQSGEAATASEGENAPAVPTQNMKFPVFYDVYTYDADAGYTREIPLPDRIVAYPSHLDEGLLCSASDEQDGDTTIEKFKLYYVPCRVTANGIEEATYTEKEYVVTEGSGANASKFRFLIVEYGEDTDFIAVKPENGNYVINYDELYATLDAGAPRDTRFDKSYYGEYARNYYYHESTKDAAGNVTSCKLKTISGVNYFRNNAGKIVNVNALTLGDIANDPFNPLNSVTLVSLVGGDNELVGDIFGKTTLGELMNGEVDFDKLVADMTLSTFIDDVAPDNKLMAYVVYKVSDLSPNGDGTYSAIFDKNGANKNVTVLCDGGFISEIKDGDIALEGTKVKELSTVAAGIGLDIMMDVKVDEPIMLYVGYGITGAAKEAGQFSYMNMDGDTVTLDYDYKGTFVDISAEPSTDRECFIRTDAKGTVISAFYVERGKPVAIASTALGAIYERVNSIKDELTVGEIIPIGEDSSIMLKAIAGTKIGKLDERIQTLKVKEVLGEDAINSSPVLKQLAESKVIELDKAIDSVLIQRIYANAVYELGLGENGDKDPERITFWKDGFEKNLFYEKDEDGRYVLAEFDLDGNGEVSELERGHLTAELFADGEYYGYGEAKGMWKLILYKDGVEKAYTLNNFNNMVNGVKENVGNATLGTLAEVGIIKREILYNSDGTAKKIAGTDITLESLTISGLIAAIPTE